MATTSTNSHFIIHIPVTPQGDEEPVEIVFASEKKEPSTNIISRLIRLFGITFNNTNTYNTINTHNSINNV